MWPKMWSLLENVPYALEKEVYSYAFGWNVLKISVRSISCNVSFKTCVSLLIFCFGDLSIGVSVVLKSPTIIVLLSISPLCLLVFVLCIEVLLCWVHRYLQLCLPFGLIPYHYVVSFLISCNLLYFNVYFVWYEDRYSSFLLLPICMEYIFPSSHFQSICVFRSEVDFLWTAYIWVLFLYPFSQSLSFGWSI